MGNINSSSSNIIKDEQHLLKRTLEHQIALHKVDSIARILETLIYCDNDQYSIKTSVNVLPVSTDNSRVSIYQILGQLLKQSSLDIPESCIHHRLLNVSGRMLKVNGQIENEFLEALNHYILEPLQQLRILHKEKVIITNILIAQNREKLNALLNLNDIEERLTEKCKYQEKEEELKSHLDNYLSVSAGLILTVQKNIYPLLLVLKEKQREMQKNLDYCLELYQTESTIYDELTEAEKNLFSTHTDSLTNLPIRFTQDYRDEIYKNPIDQYNYPINWRNISVKSGNPLVILLENKASSTSV